MAPLAQQRSVASARDALLYRDERTNMLPSESLKTADVPQDSFFGGCANSTPRALRSSKVFCTLSVRKETPENLPIRSSWPCGVNNTTCVSAPGIRSSIQRSPLPKG